MNESEDPLESTPAETTIEIASIALQALPYAGGVISSTAIFFLERRKNERLKKFLLDLTKNLNQLKDRINSDFIRTEEFRDLTEDVFSKASETRQQEKLNALRAIFLNSVIATNPKYDEVEEITNLIASWQSRHLILLRILIEPTVANNEMGKPIVEDSASILNIIDVLQSLLPDWGEDQLSRTLEDLHVNGVIHMPVLAMNRDVFLEKNILLLSD